MNQHFIQHIFSGNNISDEDILAVFHYQYNHNKVYKDWCKALGISAACISTVENIPFLPISFFKTHKVVAETFTPELIFESSGTTQTINSKHYVKSAKIYEQSFLTCFEKFYGKIDEYCIVALLPGYLERKNSSLVKMADTLIRLSKHEQSGFYLYNHKALYQVLTSLEQQKQKTLLLGVTFALIDFAETHPIPLRNTIVMDTGGMKGRRKELTKDAVYNIYKKAFAVNTIHSEYGMTELLSQAYTQGNGIYHCPTWMKVFVREEADPLTVNKTGKGVLNIIDLANIYSCSFIATDDVGVVHTEGFEVWGRRDNSDLRGCSLMVIQ